MSTYMTLSALIIGYILVGVSMLPPETHWRWKWSVAGAWTLLVFGWLPLTIAGLVLGAFMLIPAALLSSHKPGIVMVIPDARFKVRAFLPMWWMPNPWKRVSFAILMTEPKGEGDGD